MGRPRTSNRPLSILAQNIARLRKERGLTQKALAERLGMTVAHIVRIETGSYDASTSLIPQLMEILDVDANALFTAPCSTLSEDEQEREELIGIVKQLPPYQFKILLSHAVIYRRNWPILVTFSAMPGHEADQPMTPIDSAIRDGLIPADVGQRLLKEIDEAGRRNRARHTSQVPAPESAPVADNQPRQK